MEKFDFLAKGSLKKQEGKLDARRLSRYYLEKVAVLNIRRFAVVVKSHDYEIYHAHYHEPPIQI